MASFREVLDEVLLRASSSEESRVKARRIRVRSGIVMVVMRVVVSGGRFRVSGVTFRAFDVVSLLGLSVEFR